MNGSELKKNVHELINNIENEHLLRDCYTLIKRRTEAKEGALWKQLTESEKQDLLNVLEESRDHDRLISQDEMKQKHQGCL